MENWPHWLEYNNDIIMYWIWDCKPVEKIITFDKSYKAQSFILSNSKCIWTNPNFQLKAIFNCVKGIQFITNPSREIQLIVVKLHEYAIKYIDNPSDEIRLEAIKQNKYAQIFLTN